MTVYVDDLLIAADWEHVEVKDSLHILETTLRFRKRKSTPLEYCGVMIEQTGDGKEARQHQP